MSGLNPTQIKQPRLSEESTTSSSTSGSGDSEVDRVTTDDESKLPNFTGPWETEGEFLMFAESLPAIAGRYTDADPDFQDDEEIKTPPIIPNYNPRKHDQRGQGGGGRGGGGGGRWGGHSQSHYRDQGNRDHRGYGNRDGYNPYRNHGGGDGNRGNNRYHGNNRDGDQKRRYDDRQGRQ